MTILSNWQDILNNSGFHPQQEYPCLLDSTANNTEVLTDLSNLSVIEVSGEDAEFFLHNQFSNDLSQLKSGGCQLSAYCNPQGRVLAVFRIIRLQDVFMLILPRQLRAAMIKRLHMYVLRAKVTLTANDDVILLGLDSDRLLNDCLLQAPIDGLHHRQIIVCTLAQAEALLHHHRQNEGHRSTRLVDYRHWRLGDINSGLAQVFSNTSELFVPQMINLDLVDAVSFSKGCYPGQEIIARLRYLGKLKQRMIHARITGVDQILAGAPVYCAERGDVKAGLVVDAVAIAAKQHELLCTIPTTHLSAGTIFIDPEQTITLERAPLPYQLPEHSSATKKLAK